MNMTFLQFQATRAPCANLAANMAGMRWETLAEMRRFIRYALSGA